MAVGTPSKQTRGEHRQPGPGLQPCPSEALPPAAHGLGRCPGQLSWGVSCTEMLPRPLGDLQALGGGAGAAGGLSRQKVLGRSLWAGSGGEKLQVQKGEEPLGRGLALWSGCRLCGRGPVGCAGVTGQAGVGVPDLPVSPPSGPPGPPWCISQAALLTPSSCPISAARGGASAWMTRPPRRLLSSPRCCPASSMTWTTSAASSTGPPLCSARTWT